MTAHGSLFHHVSTVKTVAQLVFSSTSFANNKPNSVEPSVSLKNCPEWMTAHFIFYRVGNYLIIKIFRGVDQTRALGSNRQTENDTRSRFQTNDDDPRCM